MRQLEFVFKNVNKPERFDMFKKTITELIERVDFLDLHANEDKFTCAFKNISERFNESREWKNIHELIDFCEMHTIVSPCRYGDTNCKLNVYVDNFDYTFNREIFLDTDCVDKEDNEIKFNGTYSVVIWSNYITDDNIEYVETFLFGVKSKDNVDSYEVNLKEYCKEIYSI